MINENENKKLSQERKRRIEWRNKIDDNMKKLINKIDTERKKIEILVKIKV